MRNLKIKLDVDDCLIPYGVHLLEELKTQGIHLNYDDISKYNFSNFPPEIADAAIKVIGTGKVLEKQIAPFPGAQELVKVLQHLGHEVIISTATEDKFSDIRRKQIREFFPSVPDENVFITNDKYGIVCDIFLDDAPHHIMESKDAYPVFFSQPWNRSVTGFLSVTSYDEFLNIVNLVANDKSPADIICLVGPSGSGKTAICTELEKDTDFGVIVSSTTRKRRPDDGENAYYFVSKPEFEADLAAGKFIEHAIYNGNLYGLTNAAVDGIASKGKIAITPIEIVGARAMQKAFGKRVVTVFVNRSRKEIEAAIMARNISNTDKQARLATLDEEYRNSKFCDYVIDNNGTVEDSVRQIKRILGLPSKYKTECA